MEIPRRGRRTTPEERALLRQMKAEAKWGEEQLDQSWMKWARCVLCNARFCVNNYEDRRIRDTRIFGRWICPWCLGHGGKENLQRLIIVERLLGEGLCLKRDSVGRMTGEVGDPKKCKCTYHVALRLFGKEKDAQGKARAKRG